ncbi:Mitogen-activated protein kinase kinase kinase 14 [Acropora cervicornis]|uniref:Mitogen-activated protein kinase kinase kinase 14 n=1 Tax=Acropora cervicornis TaxID=6130 RepID=A0AAD9PX09_ACRCE|nr:Mitogen-activated protein kinase kinase kinase 14 [Acropora cervicornis]
MSAGSDEERIALDTILSALAQLPSVPSSSPDNMKEGSTTALSAKHDNSRDTQPHNVSSNFPFLGHLQETFSIHDGQFKEGTHYFVDEKIGSGAFGECYKAYTSDGSFIFCFKKTKFKQNELLALYLAKKESIETIVDFRGAKVENGNVVIFMELMKEGTLKNHIVQQKKKLPAGTWPVVAEERSLVFVRDVVTALDFLNSKGLFHGDIKGDNVLLYEGGSRLKLADFGSAGDIQVNKCAHAVNYFRT